MSEIMTIDDSELEILDARSLRTITSAEIGQQIATARQYPRDVGRFLSEVKALVTSDEDMAMECVYALPRGRGESRRTIEGGSIRFAEIILHAWGNVRAASRVIDERESFVTSQGLFLDLERNVATVSEQQRRIVDSEGRRYSIDMIGVTANAAASIALRNAVLRGVPKAYWLPGYLAAKSLIIGDTRSLAQRREKALEVLNQMGATPDEVMKLLSVRSASEITGDHLFRLRGLITAVRDHDTTIEAVMRPVRAEAAKRTDVGKKLRDGKAAQAVEEAPAVGDDNPPAVEEPKAEEKAPATVADPDPETAEALADLRREVETATDEPTLKAVWDEFSGIFEAATVSALKAATEIVETRRAAIQATATKTGKRRASAAKL